MKSIARMQVWWPNVDDAIEDLAKSCDSCARVKDNPPAAPTHQWPWPSKPWSRLHVDFADPFLNKMFFVLVDARSKWPEVGVLNVGDTTSTTVIKLLEDSFARHGLPDQLVSDNGPQFVSSEFQ